MPPPCLSPQHLLHALTSWPLLAVLLVLTLLPSSATSMTPAAIASLRQQSRSLFYHGLDAYMTHAYPEDELRPITCSPLTRDRANPAHIEVNDVLGNYSLSLVDSLSTLAILASSPTSSDDEHDALFDFQRYIALLIEEYGDGSKGDAGRGRRARGFDLDSKVQLFETTIRGLGGLLSAHLFAIGELPIRGYKPVFEAQASGRDGIVWSRIRTQTGDRFVYDGQLLRLAYDLGQRLLPAFHTPTGIPYPRVNLKYGIPFYENSPLNNDAEHGQCDPTQTPKEEREITETCSAGAGSLVLEFAVLSRLTGDMQFEKKAKKAFWAVWERRTGAGLIGSGIDAETGQWISPYTGIGAGIDSFFEYAFKSHILLSGLETDGDPDDEWLPSSTAFLEAWETAHDAIKRHIYRGPQFQHPHYAQNDMYTGGPRLAWIDSLSAYYPGLLSLAGELEEAETTHLLYTALWHRYNALPERWNAFTGKIDAGLRWWGGRPEFIESTWYLYRATQDPWYLHIGEMTLQDIKRRCWTPCGWAGLQDVRTGEQSDRMESFFLGETAKYLHLLFDPEHPLNQLDAPFVFTTEGHPLIIPKSYRPNSWMVDHDPVFSPAQCPLPPPPVPLSYSAMASREDVFHAAYLARLHEQQPTETQSAEALEAEIPSDVFSPSTSMNNHIFFPWTLPSSLIPHYGFCTKLAMRQTFDLTFPPLPNLLTDFSALQRVNNGILIKSISGLRLSLVLDDDSTHPGQQIYRIYALSNLALGRDENIWFSADVMAQLNPTDPNLSRMKDTDIIDLLIDAPFLNPAATLSTDISALDALNTHLLDLLANNKDLDISSSDARSRGEQLLRALPQVLLTDTAQLADHLEVLADLNLETLNLDRAIREAAAGLRSAQPVPTASGSSSPKTATPGRGSGSARAELMRHVLPAMLPSGPGAAPLPSKTEAIPDPATLPSGGLTFKRMLVLDSDLCGVKFPAHVPGEYEVLVVRRGGCSFSAKIRSIPSFPPEEGALKVLVVVSFGEDEGDGEVGGGGEEGEGARKEFFVRPFLDEKQITPAGTERRNPVPMIMVGGGWETWSILQRAAGIKGRFDQGSFMVERRGGDGLWTRDSGAEDRGKRDQGVTPKTVGGSSGTGEEVGGGLSIKRRYWFASNGIRIQNLHVA